MQVKDVITEDVVTITGEDSILSAAARLSEREVGCLVVVGDEGVLGIISDRDLVVRCLSEGHNFRTCRVLSHMSAPVVTAELTTDILEAASLMRERGIKRLPVVIGSHLVGLVSLSDISAAMTGPMDDLLKFRG